MAISGYEYHGTAEEALSFAIAQARLEDLYLTVIEHWSNETPRVFKPGDVDLANVAPERIGWICLTRYYPNVKMIHGDYTFVQENPDRLSIMIPEEESGDILPSVAQARVDLASGTLWKRILARFKRTMAKGGWLYSPDHNIRRLVKAHHFSAVAVARSESGEARLRDTGSRQVLLYIPGVDSTDPRLAHAVDG